MALQPLVALEDLNRIVPASKRDSSLVFNPDDTLAFEQHFFRDLARYNDHAIVISENEVSRVHLYRVRQLS